MTSLPRVALACLALALAATFAGACGSDSKDSSADKPAAPVGPVKPTATTSGDGESSPSKQVVVTMQGNRNMPEAIVVKAGQKVEWRNKDGYAHNVTSTSGEKIDSGDFTDSFSYSPKRAGTINYVCTIHSGQGGKITVAR